MSSTAFDELINVVGAADSDVIFQSSDGIQFRVHKANLKVNTRGFAPPEFRTQDEVVYLTKNSQALKLLFQFCYPEQHPYLEDMKFPVLASLAEQQRNTKYFLP